MISNEQGRNIKISSGTKQFKRIYVYQRKIPRHVLRARLVAYIARLTSSSHQTALQTLVSLPKLPHDHGKPISRIDK
jgi:hypothetical protein